MTVLISSLSFFIEILICWNNFCYKRYNPREASVFKLLWFFFVGLAIIQFGFSQQKKKKEQEDISRFGLFALVSVLGMDPRVYTLLCVYIYIYY